MPPFDVSICLPEIRKLRHLLERYRILGQAVTITASRYRDQVQMRFSKVTNIIFRDGTLGLRVESDEGEFSTQYPDCKVPVYRDETLPWRRPGADSSAALPQSASVRVDLKRLTLFLSGEHQQPKRAIANIVDREVLHIFFVHEDLMVQYFIAATSKF
jgi:hypothetical protein